MSSGSASPVPDPLSSSVLDGVAAQRYTGVAALSLVVYDILITMDVEIRYFWGRPLKLTELIYFLNRYYGLGVVIVYVYADMVQEFSDDLCMFVAFMDGDETEKVRMHLGKRIVQFGAWSGWTMILIADAIMTMRVRALFGCTRKATIFLASLYAAQGIAMMAMLVAYDHKFNDFSWHALRACGVFAPKWNSTFWIPTLVFEFILLCMTLYKSLHSPAFGSGTGVGSWNLKKQSLYRILVRDQVIYFVSILLSGCLNIALWQQLHEGTPNNEGITLSVAIPCVLGGRILMSLRNAVAQQAEMGESESDFDIDTLVFRGEEGGGRACD